MGTDDEPELFRACLNGRTRIAETLLSRGEQVDHRRMDGMTPLMAAAEAGYLETVRMIVDYGANVNLKSERQWTALMLACAFEHWEIAKVLIEREAEVNFQNDKGWTALMMASRNNMLEIVELLLDHGAHVNLQNKKGWTALMLASRYGHHDTVQLLIRHGANVDAQNEDGRTASVLACMSAEGASERESAMFQCLKNCYLGGSNLKLRTKHNKDALAVAKSRNSRQQVLFLEFVLKSAVAKILQSQLQQPRSVVVAFFERGILTVGHANALQEADLQELGIESEFARTSAMQSFQAGSEKRLSIAKRISKGFRQILPNMNEFKFDAYLSFEWGKNGANRDLVSEVNEFLKSNGKVTWFDGMRQEGKMPLEIAEGLKKSRKVVVFVTEKYMESLAFADSKENDCQKEFEAACNLRGEKNIICCIVDKSMLEARRWTNGLQQRLASGLQIDFTSAEARQKGLLQLLSNLNQ